MGLVAGWWEAGYFWEVGLTFASSTLCTVVSFVDDGRRGWVFDREYGGG